MNDEDVKKLVANATDMSILLGAVSALLLKNIDILHADNDSNIVQWIIKSIERVVYDGKRLLPIPNDKNTLI